jgi:predicted DsbA family dithiol-disulfide isomerase
MYKEAVDADWARAKELGITAVPTFAMNQGKIAGAQPYEVLEKFIKVNVLPNG